MTVISIDRRFNGPPGSANGGYACGLLARHIGRPAQVTLLLPPPLDTPLTVCRSDGRVFLLDGDTAVAYGEPFGGDIPVPEPPAVEEVLHTPPDPAVMDKIWYQGCFVCGSQRAPGDGLRVFADRPLPGGALAAVWTPEASAAGGQRHLPAEIIWAVLDCPGGWVAMIPKPRVLVLGRMAAEILEPVTVGRPCLVMGWPAGEDRRKLQVGTALFSLSGRLLAKSRATWIELRAGNAGQGQPG